MRSLQTRTPPPLPGVILPVRLTLILVSLIVLVAISIIGAHRAYLFHSENTSWTIHVIGEAPTLKGAEEEFSSAWTSATKFMTARNLFSLKVRIKKPSTSRIVSSNNSVTYREERTIDIFGWDWNAFFADKKLLNTVRPAKGSIELELPRFIPTYGDLMFVLTFLLATVCVGPLKYSRYEGDYGAGMHPLVISFHILFVGSAVLSLWNVLDQKYRPAGLLLVLGIGTALILSRWIATTRTQFIARDLTVVPYAGFAVVAGFLGSMLVGLLR